MSLLTTRNTVVGLITLLPVGKTQLMEHDTFYAFVTQSSRINNSEDICLQTLTSFSITWVKITRACGWQKSFRAGQILCAQTNFQHDFRQVSILEFLSNFDSEAFS